MEILYGLNFKGESKRNDTKQDIFNNSELDEKTGKIYKKWKSKLYSVIKQRFLKTKKINLFQHMKIHDFHI